MAVLCSGNIKCPLFLGCCISVTCGRIFFFFFFFYFFVDRFPRSFAEVVGCEMASLKACAKNKSFQELSSAQLKVFDYLNFFRFAPVVDGYFMPGMCYAIIKNVSSRDNQYGNLYTISSLRLYFWFWFTSNGGFLGMISIVYYFF